jgi:hypothetical protein
MANARASHPHLMTHEVVFQTVIGIPSQCLIIELSALEEKLRHPWARKKSGKRNSNLAQVVAQSIIKKNLVEIGNPA